MSDNCGIHDIDRDRGDTVPIRRSVWSENDQDWIDITTGYTFLLEVSSVEDWDEADSNVIISSTGVVVSGSDGQVEFPLTTSDATDNIGSFWYKMRYTDPNSKKRTWSKGRYIVS